MLTRRAWGGLRRYCYTAANDEIRIRGILEKKFPKADVDVMDTSGGCGTFYRVRIISPDFKGKSLLEQHKMVNQALGDEVKKLHGLNIETSAK